MQKTTNKNSILDIEFSGNQQIAINITAQMIAFSIGIGISFFLNRYIINAVGAEAYGFVALSTNLLEYISILTIALNSMSGRFVALSIFKKDYNQANEYYTSTFVANLVGILILLVPAALCIIFVDRVFNVPLTLVLEVRMLLGFMFLTFFMGLLCTNLNTSFYVTNRLYLSSLVNTAGQIIKGLLLFVLFMKFNAHIAFIGLVTLIVMSITTVMNAYCKNKLIPHLKINKEAYEFSKIIELIKSGVWNSITQLGNVLSNGLDLLIANLFISANGMGILAISKILPSIVVSILASLANVFVPTMTKLFAQGNFDELISYIKQSMKIIGMLLNIPIAVLIAFGDIFFQLWVPSQNAGLIHMLTIITVLPWAVVGPASIIHNIFIVVNILKINSLLVCLTGFLNVVIVFILLKYTSLELFAIAGVSTTLSIVRNLLYTLPFGAKYLNKKWDIFFPEVGKSILSVISISAFGVFIKHIVLIDGWLMLAFFATITSIIGFIFNYYIILNNNDRRYISSIVKTRLWG